MEGYLNTLGKSRLSIGICDRCSRKFSIMDLWSDPNNRGLKVCRDDMDQVDPWRLPPRIPENITLRNPRPDVSIATNPHGIITEDGDEFPIADSEYLDTL